MQWIYIFFICLHISWTYFHCSFRFLGTTNILWCVRAAGSHNVSNAVLDVSLLLPSSSSLSHVAVATQSTYRHQLVVACPCLHA